MRNLFVPAGKKPIVERLQKAIRAMEARKPSRQTGIKPADTKKVLRSIALALREESPATIEVSRADQLALRGIKQRLLSGSWAPKDHAAALRIKAKYFRG